MRRLPKPTDLPGDVFLACIDSFTDMDLKDRLIASTPAMIAASTDFDVRAGNLTLHVIATHTHVNMNVTAHEMIRVYNEKLVRKNTPGRAVYDRLKGLPKYGRCPLCCQRTVTTLDHHLNKADFPSLAVTPLNLVPSCHDCNKAKLTYKPTNSEEETLHPYYDEIEFDPWLQATLVQTNPAAVAYSVGQPLNWDDPLFERVKNHFSLLKLDVLYGSHAAEELDNIRFALIRLHDAGGANAVRSYLIENTLTYQDAYLNSWQAALYAALASSEWYCNGGFKFD